MRFETHIVIMAGGIGSRLYPLSTIERPKQFLDLLGTGKTLLQMTYERFLSVDPNAIFWVVTSERYAEYVREELPQIPDCRILCEPLPRGTTPCIAYASWKIAARSHSDQAVVIFTPADAYVPDISSFAVTMHSALSFAGAGHSIVCTGIKPTRPETGYGYIHISGTPEFDVVQKIVAFKEKPVLEVAEKYLEEGAYLWNAGIFVWRLDTIISEIRRNASGTASLMDEMVPFFYTSEEQLRLSHIFPQCEKISIDYSVMEKSDAVYVVPANWMWSDLGGFEALSEVTGKSIDEIKDSFISKA